MIWPRTVPNASKSKSFTGYLCVLLGKFGGKCGQFRCMFVELIQREAVHFK